MARGGAVEGEVVEEEGGVVVGVGVGGGHVRGVHGGLAQPLALGTWRLAIGSRSAEGVHIWVSSRAGKRWQPVYS